MKGVIDRFVLDYALINTTVSEQTVFTSTSKSFEEHRLSLLRSFAARLIDYDVPIFFLDLIDFVYPATYSAYYLRSMSPCVVCLKHTQSNAERTLRKPSRTQNSRNESQYARREFHLI